MYKFIFLTLLLFKLGSSNESHLEMENRFNFEPVGKDNIQIFHALLDKDQLPISITNNGHVDFEKDMLPLDIYGYYNDRTDEDYYALLIKTSYVIDQDISYFTEERLSSLNYMQSVMPHNKISKSADEYHLKVGFGAPDITFTMDFFDEEVLAKQYPDLYQYFSQNDNIDLPVQLNQIQHNTRFGTVMGQKTSKMSVSVSRYFREGDNKTRIINYSLNYIHNIPPVLLGGSSLLLRQMKKGIVTLVQDTKNYCTKPA